MSAISLGGLSYEITGDLSPLEKQLAELEDGTHKLNLKLDSDSMRTEFDSFIESIQGRTVRVNVEYVSENGGPGDPSGGGGGFGGGGGSGSASDVQSILFLSAASGVIGGGFGSGSPGAFAGTASAAAANFNSDEQSIRRTAAQQNQEGLAEYNQTLSGMYDGRIGSAGGYRDPSSGQFMSSQSAFSAAAEQTVSAGQVSAGQREADENMSVGAALYRDKASILGLPLSEIARAEDSDQIANALGGIYGKDPSIFRGAIGGFLQSARDRGQSPYIAEALRSAAGGEENMPATDIRRAGAAPEFVRDFSVNNAAGDPERFAFTAARRSIDPDDEDGFHSWDVAFANLSHPENPFGATGSMGRMGAARVFRNVQSNLNEFISEHNPERFGFTSAGDTRTSIYSRAESGGAYVGGVQETDIDPRSGLPRSVFQFTRDDVAAREAAEPSSVPPPPPALPATDFEQWAQSTQAVASGTAGAFGGMGGGGAWAGAGMGQGGGAWVPPGGFGSGSPGGMGGPGWVPPGSAGGGAWGGGSGSMGQGGGWQGAQPGQVPPKPQSPEPEGPGAIGYFGRHFAMLAAYEAVHSLIQQGQEVQQFNDIGDNGDGLNDVRQQTEELTNLKRQRSSSLGSIHQGVADLMDFLAPGGVGLSEKDKDLRSGLDLDSQIREKEDAVKTLRMQESGQKKAFRDEQDKDRENQQLDRIQEVRDSTARITRGDRYQSEEDQVESIRDRSSEAIRHGVTMGGILHSQAPVVEGLNTAQLGIEELKRIQAKLTSASGTKEIDPLYTNTGGDDEVASLLQQILDAITGTTDAVNQVKMQVGS